MLLKVFIFIIILLEGSKVKVDLQANEYLKSSNLLEEFEVVKVHTKYEQL